MKNHIRDDLKLNMELVPPGCHRRQFSTKLMVSSVATKRTHSQLIVAILCNSYRIIRCEAQVHENTDKEAIGHTPMVFTTAT
eukprot:scaffold58164_cov43-Cyclotella_meneghiniana.AAC.2